MRGKPEITARDFGPAYSNPEKDTDIPFEEWHMDPYRIARLLRWLELMNERPENIPNFIESAEKWQQQYHDMEVWEGVAGHDG